MTTHDFPTLLALDPSNPHTHSFIFLHGLGSTGNRFGSSFLTSRDSDYKTLQESLPGCKFIFPTAKKNRSTVFKRTRVNQWFDKYSLDSPLQREYLMVDGLRESTQFIHEIIRQEADRVGAANIFLGGISQGCACALHVLLTFEEKLGAFVGLSGYMPFQHDVNEILSSMDTGSGYLFIRVSVSRRARREAM